MFMHLHIGNIIGPVGSMIIIFGLLIIPVTFFLTFHSRYMTIKEAFIKLKDSRIQKLILTSALICLIIVTSLSYVFLQQISRVHEIDDFLKENAGVDLPTFVENIDAFCRKNVKISYNNIGALLEIDQDVSNSIVDSQLMELLGITRADLIVYQGWGSCGQIAIVIEELLNRFGYESRRAKFIGIDHEWAEVFYEGSWKIVDSGYITQGQTFMDIGDLGSDPRFSDASGVTVRFRNGTILEFSEDHGF